MRTVKEDTRAQFQEVADRYGSPPARPLSNRVLRPNGNAWAGLAAPPAPKVTVVNTVAAAAQKSDPQPQPKNIAEALKAAGNFDTLLGLLSAAGFEDLGVKGSEQVTLLAPNDAAFAKLPKGALDELRKDPARLRDLLRAHAVPGKVMIADVLVPAGDGSSKTYKKLVSLRGDVVEMQCDAHTGEHHPRINNGAARVGRGDIVFANGVVHEIDAVLAGGAKP